MRMRHVEHKESRFVEKAKSRTSFVYSALWEMSEGAKREQTQRVLAACVELAKGSREGVQAASTVLSQLTDSPGALNVCTHILDNTSDSTVQFIIANVVKDIVIRHFSSFSIQEHVQLRTYLMNYLLGDRMRCAGSNMEANNSTIRKVAQAVVVLVKRCWLDTSIVEDRAGFFVNLEALRRSGDLYNKHVALNVLDQMLGEFSSEASAFGLPWDFHASCRRSFEETELPRLFHMSMESLHEYVSHPALLNDKGELVCSRRCVAIALKILRWEFVSLGNVMAGSFEMLDQLDTLDGSGKFPASWTAALVRPQIIETVFQTHSLLLPHDISGSTAKLVVQLAAVNGPVFPDSGTEIGFLTFFLERLDGLVSNFTTTTTPAQTNAMNDTAGDELIAISETIKRTLATHSLRTLRQIPILFNFMSSVVRYTLFCIDCMKSALALLSDGEDCAGMIATDVMLEMWARFVEQANSLSQLAPPHDPFATTLASFLRSLSLPIFRAHLEMRLALAEKQVLADADSEEEMVVEDDVAYADQLDHLTVLARLDALGCVGLLCELVGEVKGKVEEVLRGVFAGAGGLDAARGRQVLLERLHWLVLIAEHVLADLGDGEVPTVPDALMAISCNAPTADADVIVTLSGMIFEILGLFSNVQPGSPMLEFCSPLTIESFFIFVKRWSRTYLFINPSDYSRMSKWLASSYSASGSGNQLFDFIIASAQQNFTVWQNEEAVLNAIINLLQSFAVRGVARDRMIQSPNFQQLMGSFVRNIKDMPTSTHSPMIRVLATISTQGSNPELEANYYNELTGMLQMRLTSLVGRPDFARVFQKTAIKNEVINTLEMYEGLCLAADYNTAGTLFRTLVGYLDAFGKLFKVYKNLAEVNLYVLRVFCEVSKMLGLHEAAFEERQAFYAAYTGVLKVYANANIGVSTNISFEEEDRFNDLSCVLETLSNLILVESKDEDRYDVVFYGVNMVLPLITAEMLKYPSLSQKALELVGNVVRHFPSKLLDLDIEVLDNILSVLRFGTTESSVLEVQKLSFEAIMGVACFCVAETRKGVTETQAVFPSIDATLQHLLDYMLFKEFDPDLMESVGETLYMLVLLRHDVYMRLAQQLLDAQPTVERRSRLEAAFGTLTTCIERAAVAGRATEDGMLSLAEYRMYSDGLVLFLMDVRGFLRVR
ncbi:armadillo-type protein [Chytriomyces sp. MP71]|nr:armadillo-type protein [Chytriomyces sp. MP71]